MSDVRQQLTTKLKARCTLIFVPTKEEQRAEGDIKEAAAAAGLDCRFWDTFEGITNSAGEVVDGTPKVRNPVEMVRRIVDDSERFVYVLRDMNNWLDPQTTRALRSAAKKLQAAPRNEARTIIILGTADQIPDDLQDHAVLVDYPLPTREQISAILDDIVSVLEPDQAQAALGNGDKELSVDAAVGLTANGAANCYASSLVESRTIDPKVVAAEKKGVIAKEAGIEWYDPDPAGLAAIGGLDRLKARAVQLKVALSQEAREFGLPAPKGLLLGGVSGCGKSLSAKAIAAAWGVTLIKADFGAMKGKYIGQSEGNFRSATKVAETIAPCIFWVDEIEKVFAGAGGSGEGDSGVSADALGTFLTWLQEKEANVFVVATANDVDSLPPELLRKGRFDDVFFVDLPTYSERLEILDVTIRKFKRDPDEVGDLTALAELTDGWTGSELAAIVPDGLFAAFSDGKRKLNILDLITAAKGVVPLSVTAREKVDKIRRWGKASAKAASNPETRTESRGRALDID